MSSTTLRSLSARDVSAFWPTPSASSTKYSRGVVGVVAGSEAFPGAAVMVVSGAFRAGAGMLRYVGPRRVQDLVLGARPETVVADAALPLPRADAWVLGPGVLGAPEQEQACAAALVSGLPCVVDAGAIALVARGMATDPSRLLLTPHASELVDLLGLLGVKVSSSELESAPVRYSQLAAERTGATVLLKGGTTRIVAPDGSGYQQSDATPWLATAGAGDVLAGVIGVLLASGIAPLEAGAMAAFVHGRAAALASAGGPITAMDVAEFVPAALRTALNAS